MLCHSNPMNHPPDQRQLELDLFPGEPWGGRSPRVLTKGYSPLFLRQKPPKAMRLVEVGDQLELWPVEGPGRNKSPHRLSVGAPSLLELLEGGS